ncbi:[protein-PII] uridylyltransferase [Saccharibacter sp. 17.LH.SD]|uniref:[protein-PII] uridylyltransferase n=1 Tax=Saccharibacter sp. 17.LH.SD TaxID=2689393 RepID=UPI00136F90A7|nr:[protein-PII] uridylyltransferase [Saccharibacter sp. 17.LH.SD]MXV44141.1 [protein-PII] uridylyltransferase [Saccharibacter sp. 17.LH.SD]
MHLSAPQASRTSSSAHPFSLPRKEALERLRKHLGGERERVRQQFENQVLSGVEAARELSHVMDHIIDELARCAGLPRLSSPEEQETFCLCATGGYGAGLLAPFSDIDLLFLTDESPSQTLLRQIEYVLYTLWDLGLRVGHATRSYNECLKAAEQDLAICTSLLDLRPLYGQKAPAGQLRAAIREYLTGSALDEFISKTIAQREDRHLHYGASPYLVEPHLKAGRGGLRDLHVLNWIGHAALGTLIPQSHPLHRELGLAPACVLLGLLTGREIYRAEKVWNFLWTVRFHLHYITGRNEERLTFDVQPIIGARMGYAHHGRQRGVERFMRHYFLMARSVMRLAHVLQPAILLHLQNQQRGRPPHIEAGPEEFRRIDGCLSVTDPTAFAREPRYIFRILDTARRHQLPLHPSSIQQIIRFERHTARLVGDPETSRLFLNLLCEPAPKTSVAPSPDEDRNFWFPLLNEIGLLSRFIPGWSRILGRTQFDGYHIYTVDKHTIEAIRILRQIEIGHMADEIPGIYAIARNIQAREALFMATLLHDIGKGRGGGHSEIGAQIAVTFCQQLGLSSEDSDTISWLVLHHLLLSRTAFTRDIDDPQTILDLADTIQSPERLRLLLLLTIADTRAVGPKAWNAWKATLLHRLYSRIADVLDGGMQAKENDERVKQTRSLTYKALRKDLPEEAAQHFLQLGKAGYWLGFDTQTHMRHARLIHQHLSHDSESHITIDIQPLPSRGITELTVICADQPGIFALITGALALCEASIADARIHTLSNGMVLDSFWIQDGYGEAFEEPDHVARLKETIDAALTGNIDLPVALAAATPPLTRRLEALNIPSRIVIDNDASDSFSVVEVNGRDRPALLYDITAALSRASMHISSAHITTYGLRAVDVFYLYDQRGEKITEAPRIESLRNTLLQALKEPSSQNI